MAIESVFLSRLNSDGYGFQHAVINAIRRAGHPWQVAASEFPVSYRGRNTHVDLLAWCHKRFGLLVGECKRVNPRFGAWGFARSPFTFDDRDSHGGWLEQLLPRPPAGGIPHSIVRGIPAHQRPFHIAVEIKTAAKGDEQPTDSRGRAFNDALNQIDIGVNGVFAMLVAEKKILDHYGPVIAVPTIFTTAKLYTTDAALDRAEIETGEIANASFEEVPWLWFEHNVSPELLHEVQRQQLSTVQELTGLLPIRHTRSVAIVSATGLDRFLEQVASMLAFLYSNPPHL